MATGYIYLNVYGDRIHIFERFWRPDTYTWTFMATKYIYLNVSDDQIHIFERLWGPDTYTWTFMATGYIFLNDYGDRIHIFEGLCWLDRIFKRLCRPDTNIWTFMATRYICLNVYGDQIHIFECLWGPDTYLNVYGDRIHIFKRNYGNWIHIFKCYADWIHLFGGLCWPFENRQTVRKDCFFKSSNANRNIHKIFCFMQFLQRTKWRLDQKQHYKLLKHVQTWRRHLRGSLTHLILSPESRTSSSP